MPDMTSQRDHELDGLRGIAALAVVLSHIAAITWVPFIDGGTPNAWQHALWYLGAPAVDMFLVLSGYVVTKSLTRRTQDYFPYILSRYIRLAPIAWMAVLAGLALRSVDMQPPPGTSESLLALAKPLGTWDILGFATLIAPVPQTEYLNPPLWTIFIEIQAAFAMPFLAAAAKRWPLATAPVGLALLLVVALASNFYYPIYFSGFVLGAALCTLEGRLPKAPRPFAIAIVGFAILMLRHVLSTEDPLLRPVCAIGAVLIILAVRQGAWNAALRSDVAQWLGRISYPLYAVHWPIMAAVVLVAGGLVHPAIAALCSIPLALAAATFARRHVDGPSVTLSHLVKSRDPR